jgi:hypothetical protein
MTERVIGPTGSKRRRRTLLLLPLAALAALMLAIMGSAANGPSPINFEIEGNLEAGAVATGTAVGSDWINLDSGNGGLGALQCPNNASSCSPGAVVDGPALGTGELFRDDLKVDPDHTTFTQGDKENDFANVTDPPPAGGVLTSDTPWHIVTGSVPPQKDDLFDIASNTYVAGTNSELDLGMLRTNNNGSSHVDFELNRLSWLPGSTDGVTCGTDTTGITGFKCPKRTEGDVLISFEISPSSTTPPVSVATRLFVWDLPGGTDANGHGRGSVDCQGPLTGNENTCPWEEITVPSNGSLAIVTAANAAEIPAGPWGSRLPDGTATSTIPPGGWFEAAIDLDRLGFPPSCPGFGTMSAKSRSSGSSVTSALTDLAGPFPVDLDVCGKITIIKDAQPNGAQDFSYTTTGGLTPSTFSLDDDADATLSNTKVYDQLSTGAYSVTEGAQGGGYTFSNASCVVDKTDSSSPTSATGGLTSNITLGNNGEVTCTYVNVLQRSLIISKVAKDASTSTTGNEPLGGVTFTISPDPTDGVGTLQVTDDGAGDQFATTVGKLCVNLGSTVSASSFSITETVPTGYAVVAPNPKTGIAPTSGTCATRGTTATADAAFVNTPLSTVTVTFSSQATGANGPATAANISCSPAGTTTEQGSADPAFDDTSESFADLSPGTVTCTINIDP